MSTTIPPTQHLYRSILRELRLASKKPRATRNQTMTSHLRSIVESSSSDSTHLQRSLLETRDYLRSSRIHAELLKRYNPIADMTEEEKIHATARRVGLETPKLFKPE